MVKKTSEMFLRKQFNKWKRNSRSWKSFAGYHDLQLPNSFRDVTRRTKKNLTYFRSNYLLLSLILIVYWSILNPVTVFLVTCLLLLVFSAMRSEKKSNVDRLFGHRVQPRQVFLALLGAIFIPTVIICGFNKFMLISLFVFILLLILHSSMHQGHATGAGHCNTGVKRPACGQSHRVPLMTPTGSGGFGRRQTGSGHRQSRGRNSECFDIAAGANLNLSEPDSESECDEAQWNCSENFY